MDERPKVVVDVQFQGKHADDDIIREQFEFELVGSRIHVRPIAADHPQGKGKRMASSAYPRKRPASPFVDSYQRSRSPSPSKSRNMREQKYRRYMDRSTSPYPDRNVLSEDSHESVNSLRWLRATPRKINQENSMWNITKREYEDLSLESSGSSGNIECGAIHYCMKRESSGNYGFTEQSSKRNNRVKQERRDSAIQAGYDEELILKKLKQFTSRRNESETSLKVRQTQHISKYESDAPYPKDEEGRKVKTQSKQPEKNPDCTFRCRPCCSKQNPPAILYEQHEMFASSETTKTMTTPEKEEESKQVKIKKEEDRKKESNSRAEQPKPKSIKKETHIPNSTLRVNNWILTSLSETEKEEMSLPDKIIADMTIPSNNEYLPEERKSKEKFRKEDAENNTTPQVLNNIVWEPEKVENNFTKEVIVQKNTGEIKTKKKFLLFKSKKVTEDEK